MENNSLLSNRSFTSAGLNTSILNRSLSPFKLNNRCPIHGFDNLEDFSAFFNRVIYFEPSYCVLNSTYSLF